MDLTCEPQVCRKWWVGTRTYTAKCPPCPDGKTGPEVRITRQYISYISQRDAEDRALECAMKAANAALICLYHSTQCVNPLCFEIYPYQICRDATSNISQADADIQAIRLATTAAAEVCAAL